MVGHAVYRMTRYGSEKLRRSWVLVVKTKWNDSCIATESLLRFLRGVDIPRRRALKGLTESMRQALESRLLWITLSVLSAIALTGGGVAVWRARRALDISKEGLRAEREIAFLTRPYVP